MPIFCGYAVLCTHGLTGKNVTVSIGMSIFKSSEINWFLGFLPKRVKSAWNLVFAAYSAARHANAEGRWGNWTRAQLKRVGDVCRQVRGEALAAFIAFVVLEQMQGRSVQSIVEQLVSYLSR